MAMNTANDCDQDILTSTDSEGSLDGTNATDSLIGPWMSINTTERGKYHGPPHIEL